jgi:hypothetical protein
MRFRPSRLSALVALAVFVASLGVRAADTRHAFGGDPDVDGGVLAALSEMARVGAEPQVAEGSDEHCVICHWGRTFAGSLAGDLTDAIAPAPTPADHVAWIGGASASHRLTTSPRGPPSLL